MATRRRSLAAGVVAGAAGSAGIGRPSPGWCERARARHPGGTVARIGSPSAVMASAMPGSTPPRSATPIHSARRVWRRPRWASSGTRGRACGAPGPARPPDLRDGAGQRRAGRGRRAREPPGQAFRPPRRGAGARAPAAEASRGAASPVAARARLRKPEPRPRRAWRRPTHRAAEAGWRRLAAEPAPASGVRQPRRAADRGRSRRRGGRCARRRSTSIMAAPRPPQLFPVSQRPDRSGRRHRIDDRPRRRRRDP